MAAKLTVEEESSVQVPPCPVTEVRLLDAPAVIAQPAQTAIVFPGVVFLPKGTPTMVVLHGALLAGTAA